MDIDIEPTGEEKGNSEIRADSRIRIRKNENYPDTIVEYHSQYINPEARAMFPEITRDLRLSNLGDMDIILAETYGDIIRYLEIVEQTMRKRGITGELKTLDFYRSRLQYLANTRAAYEGFMALLGKTERYEEINMPRTYERYPAFEEERSGGNVLSGIINRFRRRSREVRLV